MSLLFAQYLRKSREAREEREQEAEGGSSQTVGKDGFKVTFDVAHFKPTKITVRTVGTDVVIEGFHEDHHDAHNSISHKFTRRYTLPKGYDPKTVTSALSQNNMFLTIKAPKPANMGGSKERMDHYNEKHHKKTHSKRVSI
jgi:HSP20 family molecular chaperone IbpA